MRIQTRSHGVSRQTGLTLVELMVGITVGLVVVAALLVLFANSSTSGSNLARSSAQIENGRYVSELLREDFRLAGFYGEMPDSATAAVYTTPDPCATTPTGFVNSPFGLPTPLQGFPPYVAAAAPTCLSDRKLGTSALVIRYLAVDQTPVSSIPVGNQQYYVQNSFCATDLSSTLLIFDKAAANFTLKSFACSSINPVRAYVSRTYYVASCNVCSPSDNTPTLKRVELLNGALVTTSIAEGIEALRFEYGFDTLSSGNADTYLTDANSPGASGETAKWQNVMAVKVHFIVRSLDKVIGGPSTAVANAFTLGNTGSVSDPGDGYARRAYSTTIRIVNPSGARE